LPHNRKIFSITGKLNVTTKLFTPWSPYWRLAGSYLSQFHIYYVNGYLQ